MKKTKLYPVLLAIDKDREEFQDMKIAAIQTHMAREALDLAQTTAHLFLPDPVQFDDLGAPHPQNGTHFSLTHKPRFAGAVVARRSIGIDVEEIKPRKHSRTFDYVGNEDEWKLAPKIDTENFFRFWTAKEAVLKALGTGLRELKDCHILKVHPWIGVRSNMVLDCRSRQWLVEQYLFEDHMASITSNGDDVEWIIKSQ